MEPSAFLAIMGSLASGVSVVTALDASGRPHGLTSSSVCSVSKDPPLLLFCVRQVSSTLDAIRETGGFAVNFLDADGHEVSDLFASCNSDKFANVAWRPGDVAGMPRLEPTVAFTECALHDVIAAGDHVIVLGRLVGGATAPDRFPLGYWRGTYVRVSHPQYRREERNGQRPSDPSQSIHLE
ncbi:flavin reductase family protein [Micromonospora sp. DT4]|uniref:flavin reductase family protein n=1 Tax=Micromonospora sp. DT4 TaxID=3393438 RepID=UPI003CE6CBCC